VRLPNWGAEIGQFQTAALISFGREAPIDEAPAPGDPEPLPNTQPTYTWHWIYYPFVRDPAGATVNMDRVAMSPPDRSNLSESSHA
jgi:hypothetical protein